MKKKIILKDVFPILIECLANNIPTGKHIHDIVITEWDNNV